VVMRRLVGILHVHVPFEGTVRLPRSHSRLLSVTRFASMCYIAQMRPFFPTGMQGESEKIPLRVVVAAVSCETGSHGRDHNACMAICPYLFVCFA